MNYRHETKRRIYYKEMENILKIIVEKKFPKPRETWTYPHIKGILKKLKKKPPCHTIVKTVNI